MEELVDFSLVLIFLPSIPIFLISASWSTSLKEKVYEIKIRNKDTRSLFSYLNSEELDRKLGDYGLMEAFSKFLDYVAGTSIVVIVLHVPLLLIRFWPVVNEILAIIWGFARIFLFGAAPFIAMLVVFLFLSAAFSKK